MRPVPGSLLLAFCGVACWLPGCRLAWLGLLHGGLHVAFLRCSWSGPGDPGRRGRHGALSLLGAGILVNSSAPLDCCCSHYPSSSAVTSSIQPLRSERSLYIHAHTHTYTESFS